MSTTTRPQGLAAEEAEVQAEFNRRLLAALADPRVIDRLRSAFAEINARALADIPSETVDILMPKLAPILGDLRRQCAADVLSSLRIGRAS